MYLSHSASQDLHCAKEAGIYESEKYAQHVEFIKCFSLFIPLSFICYYDYDADEGKDYANELAFFQLLWQDEVRCYRYEEGAGVCHDLKYAYRQIAHTVGHADESYHPNEGSPKHEFGKTSWKLPRVVLVPKSHDEKRSYAIEARPKTAQL